MPTGARLILTIDISLAAGLTVAIVVQSLKFLRHRRQSASQE